MDKKRIYLSPSYMKKFKCIGDSCEDTCCYGWRICINQDTYKKYKKVVKSDLKPIISKHITRNRSNPSYNNYAKLKMNEQGYCPFLSENKLCSLQKELGNQYLSPVCMTYPRITNNVNSILEKSLTLSCPEAARLVLLNKDIMEFDELEESIDTENIILFKINTEEYKYKNKAHKYLWDLRFFSILIVQNRNYNLWERLIILGLFIQKIQACIETGHVDYVPNIINEYNKIIKEDFFRDSLKSIPTNLAIQMELMKEFNDQRFSMPINQNTKAYVNCLVEFLQGVEYTQESTVEEISERYKDAYKNYYEPFMKNNENILENYLVNHIYKDMFPISSKEGVFDDYVRLVVYYALIKMMLIGMSRYYKKLNEDIIIRLIYSFSRAIEHNKIFVNNTINLFKNSGYNTMAYMSILIKN